MNTPTRQGVNPRPLVSVYTIVRNGAASIKRCIDSILNQDYSNIEIIVQDGVSTDDTIEILRDYGDKIHLESAPDSGLSEGFHRALKRCNGDIVIACLADEELLPHAVSWGVGYFSQHPDHSVVYGDMYLTDITGNIQSKICSRAWNFKEVFCSEFAPFFSSAFFRKECFTETNLFKIDTEGYDGYADWCIWWVLGVKYQIRYVPEIISKYSLHSEQLSDQVDRHLEHLTVRLKVIEKITGDNTNSRWIRKLRKSAIAGCYLHNAEHFVRLNALAEANAQLLSALKYKPSLKRMTIVIRKMQALDKNILQTIPNAWKYKLCEKYLIVKEKITVKIQLVKEEIKVVIQLQGIQKVAIFGASLAGRVVKDFIEKRGIDTICYLDNAKPNQGQKVSGITVHPVDYLSTKQADNISAVVIAATNSKNAMIKQLNDMGFNRKIIVFAPHYVDWLMSVNANNKQVSETN